MAYEVASIFTLKDNFTSHLKEMIGNQNKFKTDSKLLSTQLNSTYNTLKKESKLAGSAMSKALREAQKEFSATGKHSDEMKRKIRDAVAKKVKLQFDTDSIKNAEKEIKKIDKEIKNINREKISPKFSSGSSGGSSIFKNALGVASGIGIYNIASSAINTTGSLFTNALNQAGQREQSAIAFETMLKDKAKGQKMVSELTSFAITTPFEYADLEKNATFALAMGFKDNDIVSLLSDVGNASAGLSKGSVGIESMVRALGQMQNKGKVSMEEINQLSENGVKALEYLSEATGKSKAEMMKYIEKGLVPADKAIAAIRKGMRTDFGSMMIKQSKTLFGLFSNIKDFVNLNVFGKFGEGLRLGIMPTLTKFVDKLTGSKDGISKFEDKLMSIGKTIGTYVSGKFESMVGYFDKLFNDEQFKKADLGGKIGIALDNMYKSMNDWYNGKGGESIKSFFEGMAKGAVDILVVALTKGIPQFVDLGLKFGSAMIDGIGKALADKAFGTITDEQGKNFKFKIFTTGTDVINNARYYSQQNKDSSKEYNSVWEATKGVLKDSFTNPFSRAMGVKRVPHDNYPIMAHEGEQLLTKQEANNKKGNGSITIAKLADQIIVREEADIDKIADSLVRKIKQAQFSYGGVY